MAPGGQLDSDPTVHRSRVVTTVRGGSLAGQTSISAGSGAAPVHGVIAREADLAASADPPSASVAERSPALLRRVNEVTRAGRRGRPSPSGSLSSARAAGRTATCRSG